MNAMQVADWTESDLVNNIPNQETDFYEFKSGQTPPKEFKTKVVVAASAFWNSGGGLLIVGVDNSGQIDGGVDTQIGRQSISDWIDQILYLVNPVGPYEVKVIHPENANSLIQSGKVVVVLNFGESTNPPHMAPDHIYYLRAGAHSVPATHYLVEAIRARRKLQQPLLCGILRMSKLKYKTIELAVVALNDAPAIRVQLGFDPLPKSLSNYAERFPLTIPVISQEFPFTMDISHFHFKDEWFGEGPIDLLLDYQDISGKIYAERQSLAQEKSIGPIQIGSEGLNSISDELKRLSQEVKRLYSLLDSRLPSSPDNEIQA